MRIASGSVWAMDQVQLQSMMDQAVLVLRTQSMVDIAKAAAADDGLTVNITDDDAKPYTIVNGEAHIDIRGPLIEGADCLMVWLFGAIEPSVIAAAVKMAAADKRVETIVLDIDSPGGTSDSITDLADAVLEARQSKHVRADVHSLCASAAYWVASQADEITAGRADMVGSIGVYSVIYDSSKALEDEGLKVHVLRTDELKGIGVAGDKLTKAQLAAIQDNVDQVFFQFKADIQRAREGVDNKAMKGRVWIGEQAMNLGLVDSIRGITTAVEPAINTTSEEDDMADQKTDDQSAAKVEELTGMTQQLAAKVDELTQDLGKAMKANADYAAAIAEMTKAAEEHTAAMAKAAGDNRLVKAEAAGLKGRVYGDDGAPNWLGKLAHTDPETFDAALADLAVERGTVPTEAHGGGSDDSPGTTDGQRTDARVKELTDSGMDASAARLQIIGEHFNAAKKEG